MIQPKALGCFLHSAPLERQHGRGSQPKVRTRVLLLCDRLDHLPPEEIDQKRRALTAVRPAFVMGHNASMERPSAAEFLLSETCRKARIVRKQRGGATPTMEPHTFSGFAGGAHRRCMLW